MKYSGFETEGAALRSFDLTAYLAIALMGFCGAKNPKTLNEASNISAKKSTDVSLQSLQQPPELDQVGRAALLSAQRL